MPNWCYTNIVISSYDEVKVNDLYNKIKEWVHKDYCENGFRSGWLGNIVGNSGIADPLSKDSPRCRGTLESIYIEDNRISLSTETAWAPMMKMWVMICNKYLPDAEITYTAEEPGNCIYETNDPDVVGSYYIDVWDPPDEYKDEESMYEVDEDNARKFLQRTLKTKETDIDKLITMSFEADWFAVHRWENVELENCE